MNNQAPTIPRAHAFVEEALRWLPSKTVDPIDTLPPASCSPRPSVLLAEDNADMRDYVEGLLKEDYDVTAVANGLSALDAIHRFRPDLVLADVMMPGLDGLELLTAIRGDPTLRDIPVILLSARARDADRIEGLDLGVDDYVTKPFSAQELQARVRANLSLARMRREALLAMVESDEKLRRLNEHLEERIQAEVQTHKAALMRLAQAEKMAALGQLAGGMAHDFNNILQVISVYAGFIQQKSGDVPAVIRMARVMEEAARRGHSVTQRLLAFARQDGLQPEPIDVRALLDGMREVITHTLGRQVSLVIDLAEELPSVLVDRSKLETVLINIATNAGDAMPDGGTLTFSARPEPMTDSDIQFGRLAETYVRISVHDTGAGMDATTLVRVTEPFFTTKPVGKGTGLGLAMANSFAEQSGGALTIISALGEGTTVTLLLPSTGVRELAVAPTRDESTTAINARRSSVLLVDDQALVRNVIADLLEDSGYDVIQAGDAAEALDVLMTGKTVDILVSDLSMPGLDGISLIRAAQTQRPGLPAVLLTGYVGDAPLMTLGGSFSLLRKPVNRNQLIDQVKSLLAEGDEAD
ncbi:response regulator [Lichenifustis flavocetrariae]|uniref:histidine kinase n=1 Tax=Lichenifustis flavocetrariae TaxID=2949735 RepID=A0AA41Z3J5_9HYPH|nr:response regulator [Lichenifustis flavocetrariae]MCW6512253.1 response regulator [Lichenifustis flavocetrariae]